MKYLLGVVAVVLMGVVGVVKADTVVICGHGKSGYVDITSITTENGIEVTRKKCVNRYEELLRLQQEKLQLDQRISYNIIQSSAVQTRYDQIYSLQ